MIPEPCNVLQSVDLAIGEAFEAVLRGVPGWPAAVDRAASRIEDAATQVESVGCPAIARQLDHLASDLQHAEFLPRPAALEAVVEIRDTWAGTRGLTPPGAIKSRAG